MKNALCSVTCVSCRPIGLLAIALFVSVFLGFAGVAHAQNEIVTENSLPGNPPSEWDISGAGDPSIQGFATDISVDQGQTIDFKIDTPATDYRLDIYRLGYYNGDGARLVATIEPSATLPQTQPACVDEAGDTELLDCGTWAVSASWTVPTNATSGIYLAKLVREDGGGTGEGSHIAFIVRDDDGGSALLFQTSDTTWQAYNRWGEGGFFAGDSLYTGTGTGGKAEKISYNRPFSTRESPTEDWLFNAEYPMVRWLERNGYDVSYFTNIDTDRYGSEILEHQVFLSIGHDEYWSRAMRDNVEAARDAGVHLAFFSGNEVYWKIRWEDSVDGSGTPYRTLVCYKEGTLGESNCGGKCDPEPNIWTGLWRDGCTPTYTGQDACEPENALTGQISWMGTTGAITVPAAYSAHWFWQNTSVAQLNAGETATFPSGTLGYEWDQYQATYDSFYPAGLVRLSETTFSGQNHYLSLYQAGSGAWVFGAGTVQWSWGLDSNHDRGSAPEDVDMQQATVNLLGEMGVTAGTLQVNLIPYAPCVPDCTGRVCGDDGCGGSCGDCVPGSTTCDEVPGTCVACDPNRCDGFTCGDDGCGGTCGTCLATEVCSADPGICQPLPCPCSLWVPMDTPANVTYSDSNPIEVGVRFQSAVDGYITGIRFYKTVTNTGTHTGNLWDEVGTLLGSAVFTGETASGWQEVQFAAPVAVTAGTNYIASNHSTTGNYALDEYYFLVQAHDAYPLSAPQDGAEGAANGVYTYSATPAFPTSTWHSANYWVDVVYDTTATDTTPPAVIVRSPSAGATGVVTTTVVTATFNEAIDDATLTFELRDPTTALVSSTVTYDPGTRTATLTPDSNLDPSTTYDVTVDGALDLALNPMAAPDTWSFTTGAPPGPPPDEGPGGPVLVIADAANPFGRYFAEILRTEGLNYFTVTDISLVDATVLNAHDVVVLGEMSLSAPEVTLLTNWVDAGGQLIAMRPDPQLAALLGLTVAGGTLSNGYVLFDTAAAPGQGLVSQTIQFHGTADLYTLNGAVEIATLYSDASTATPNPAVTLNSFGSNGGQAAAFTYDLARSVVYTRQGNPAWVGQERDGASPIRSNDLFYGGAEADWIDLSKVAIPQADEQQRLLAKLVRHMNTYPLPRFWYFPSGHKAVVIMTGDQHGCCASTLTRFDTYISQSPGGCVVEDWECVRASSYVYPGSGSIPDIDYYENLGFEIGVHVNTGCANFTQAQLDSFYSGQLATFYGQFPNADPQDSERTHCIAWADWVYQPNSKILNNIRLDVNYYFWPPAWVNNTPGMFTGSGMVMRFADLDGTMIDVYQAVSQMTDESGQTFPFTIDTLLDRAIGAEGYYGAFTANMHTDSASHAGSNAIVNSALTRGVPVVSGRQMLEWLDGRNGSSFDSMSWVGNTLSFTVTAGTGARNLQAMIPTTAAPGTLSVFTLDSVPVSYTTETIKGTEYAVFATDVGTYEATFAPDTTPPVISGINAVPDTDGTAEITWDTDELADSLVEYGTDSGNLNLSEFDGLLVTSHSVTLTGLSSDTTYYYQVTSVDGSTNSATEPTTPASFTTPGPVCFLDELFADFDLGTPGADTHVSLTTDGEVILTPAEAAEFEGVALPAGWGSYDWSTGTTTVSGGSVTVDATRVNPTDETGYAAGHTLEFVATFGGDRLQHVGFGGGTNIVAAGGLFNTTPWLLLSTGSSGGVLQARINVPSVLVEDVTIPGSYLGTPHLYRIEWTATGVEFFIDDVSVHSGTAAIGTNMRPGISDFDPGGNGLTVDWIRMTPHSASGSFESRVYDALSTASWGTATWNSTEPASTGISLSVRTGNTPVPDGSWTAYTAVSQGNTVGGSSRYAQYRADLSTGDTEATPVLDDVLISCTAGADTIAPSVLSTTPVDLAVDVPLDTTVTINYDEVINTGTFSATISGGVTHTTAFLNGDTTVELTPDVPLSPGTLYTVTVAAGVEDASGNPTAAPFTFEFTTESPPCAVDDLVTEFNAGTTGPDTYVSLTDDGEVTLAPTEGAEFEGGPGVPTGWTTGNASPWGGGTPTVVGGQLTVDGSWAATTATYDPDLAGTTYSLQFVATFDAAANQHIGFSDAFASRWAIFSTRGTTNTLYARAVPGSNDSFAIVPATYGLTTLIGSPHLYRIDWNDDATVDFYIDGVFITTLTSASLDPMSPIVSDLDLGGPALIADWMRMGPYSITGSYESRVFDAGAVSSWQAISWTSDEPAGTTLPIEVRRGDTPVPDGTWTGYVPVTSGGLVGGSSRYLQYRALPTTSDTAITPALFDITIDCDVGVDTFPPVITNVLATPGLDTATITWDTNEPADSLVEYGTSPGVLDQSQSDAALTAAHTIVLTALTPGMTYYYRVTSVDAALNSATEPPLIDPELEFTTTPPICFEDIDLVDFGLGTPDADVAVVEIDDGEVILDATEEAEFDGVSLPVDWFTHNWDPGGIAVVGGGVVTVDAVRINPTDETGYPAGRSLEFVATFGTAPYQHVGFGAGSNSPTGEMFNTTPWAMFSTGSGSQLQARVHDGTTADDTNVGANCGNGTCLGESHRYRIDWGATQIDFYIDDTLVASRPFAISDNMRPGISDLQLGGATVTADWIRMTPYSAAGTFTSRVFDSGESSDWGVITWTTDEPAGTGVAITVQAGETATPDGSWTSTTIPSSGDTVGLTGRYVQYFADLSTSVPDQTPVLRDINIECLPAAGCIDNLDCDDSDPCTDDVCNAGTCENNPLPDGDGDGVCDAEDPCPLDNPDDSDGDTVCDSSDVCPGQNDLLDTDTDGTPDCLDGCPNDINKTAPGICGCGVPDTDTDSDGTPDCNDLCPNDINKIAPGDCGCGNPDDDIDGDGTSDCLDTCIDVDNDTYGSGTGCAGTDCDDSDPDVYPGAPEICDGVDNQCSGDAGFGQVDEEPDATQSCLANETCSGGICVNSIISMPDCASADEAATILVPISATPVDGIEGLDINFQYDPAVLTAVDVQLSGMSTAATCDATANLGVPGMGSIAYFCTYPLVGTEPILYVEFTVVGTLGQTSLLDLTFAEANEGAVTTSMDDGLFTVDPNICDDSDVCTTDTCDPIAGCVYTPAPNRLPVADANGPYVLDQGEPLTLDGSGSTDPDVTDGCGDSLTYAWDLDNDGQFDDATGSAPVIPWATLDALGLVYPADPGTGLPNNTITLRVTDNFAASNTTTSTLTIYDNSPTASFTANPNPANCGQDVSFDATGSSHGHPSYSIVQYDWDFGDGNVSLDAGPTVLHTYDIPDDYSVTLTVTDDNVPARTDQFTLIVTGADDAPTWYRDVDADSFGDAADSVRNCIQPGGYVSDNTDCDDTSNAIYPGAPEIPDNGIDEDCNGFDSVTCYTDSDADNFGDPASPVVDPSGTCSAGTVSDNTDCDDTSNAIYPGAPEIPDNGIDEDCNGFDSVTCYTDSDADNFGDPASPVVDPSGTCSAGTVSDNTDCDDTSNAIYPGAPEIPDNGIDEDCNGFDSVTCYTDSDADNFGDPASPVVDPSGTCSAGTVSDNTDCDDTSNAIYPGAPEIPDNGIDEDCNGFDSVTCYTDSDADNFGDPASPVVDPSGTCSAGTVSDNTDCDDTSNAIYPGAPEIPDNGIDEDCNGFDSVTCYTDSDADNFGDPASPVVDPSGTCSAGTVSDNTDCDDTSNAIYPGAPEIPDNGIDEDCNGFDSVTCYTDSDADNFGDPASPVVDPSGTCSAGTVSDNTDCDDTSNAIYPGAPEIPDNGIDEDCNGFDSVTCYTDSDADNFGDPASPVVDPSGTCSAGTVSDNTDCDDTSNAIYPGAPEIPDNGIDEDCNGFDSVTCYTDSDADNFGDPASPVVDPSGTCSAGTVSDNTDCDDTSNAIYPGAPEIPDNGIDEDCNGFDSVTCYTDSDADNFGDPASPVVDPSGTCSAGTVSDNTDCDDTSNAIYPGAPEIPDNGIDEDCNGFDSVTCYTDSDADNFGDPASPVVDPSGTCSAGTVSDNTDCDDTSNAIYPGAPEIPDNGIDEDCNGFDSVTCYTDSDADNFGDPASPVVDPSGTCSAGTVSDNTDCDDTSNAIYPGAPEIPDNGIDEDCNGFDSVTCYTDSDADNFGDPASPVVDPSGTCSAGTVSDNTDCDDTSNAIYPGAPEIPDNGIDEDCNGFDSVTCYTDSDADNFGDPASPVVDPSGTCSAGTVSDNTDCDDTSNAIYPGAPEIPDNGIDEDCNGFDSVTCYTDSDADNFGDPASPVVDPSGTCSAGTVSDNTDCDDTSNAIYPGAPEIPDNGIDEDCNGFDSVTCYTDSDADNFGDPASPVVDPSGTCSAGTVSDNTDCDDTSNAIYPGAPEIPDNGIDEDCNGFDSVTCYTDSDADNFGDPASPVVDPSGTCSAGTVSDNTDCDDTSNAIYPGAPEIPDNGIDEDCNGFDSVTCYTDSDADNFGDPASPVVDPSGTCSAGTVSDNTDCDDTSNAIYPGAPEIPDNGIDEDCNGFDSVTCYTDSDADNFGDPASPVVDPSGTCSAGTVSDNTDCDDTSNAIYPGAPEIPDNGIDEDCNGFDSVTCYTDSDADNFGDPASPVVDPSGTCSAGTVSDNTDCDDTSNAIYPGAPEIPDNGIDEDCNGFDSVTCYTDSDADNFGDPASPVVDPSGTCSAGTVSDNTDCDDTSNAIYPGAPEIPDNGIDEDCNGFDSVTCYTDSDADNFGDPASPVVDPSGTCSAGTVSDNTDCDDTDDANFPGNTEICDGQDNDCDTDVDEGLTFDVDGDGYSSPVSCEGTRDDCDDTNDEVFPGAPEICDGIDNQCTGDPGFGVIDETGDALCTNGLYCDGVEICAGVLGCQDGPDIVCDDGSTCTTGLCNEGTDTCDFTNNGSCAVTGNVFYYRDGAIGEPSLTPVPDIDIDLSIGTTADGTADAATDPAGAFSFPAQAGTINISTLPEFSDAPKPWEYTNVITAYDASLVAQHSVEIITLTANQFIAGDVTNNGDISAYDAAKIAQLSVRLADHFDVANDTSSDWRFLACLSYPSCDVPFYLYDPLLTSETDDFYAILYGDVSGNWTAASYSGRGIDETRGIETTPEDSALALQGMAVRDVDPARLKTVTRAASLPEAVLTQTIERTSVPGRFVVTLSLSNADGILGLDLDLGYDAGRVSIVGVRTLDIASQFSVATNDRDGRLRLGLFSPVALEGSGEILSIEVQLLRRGAVKPFTIEGDANEGDVPLRIEAAHDELKPTAPGVPRNNPGPIKRSVR